VNAEGAYATTRIEAADIRTGFRSGVHALDDYFRRHALANDVAGAGRAYVLRRSEADDASLPELLGFYTLSMAQIESKDAAEAEEENASVSTTCRADRTACGGRTCAWPTARRGPPDRRASSRSRHRGAYSVEDVGWPRRMFMALETARSALST
jgi:hypothetical protein